ncbi:ATP-binding cassette domain-containing protein [Escherichia coli]|uniref:ATP-binding cassette domain-containing protein n=1 Tax=Escherichia coli TaxID=562 RepID=UPI0017A7042E|nr:ATP-binding cassette domain-containing protein [Escherichia coli]EFF1848260.1 ATP-binding cassette domain-containing protein [Escherichia coli]EFH5014460.1 ATP-binding cassette domain-containing protein [Escherichia coli]EFH5148071.1 ATP-binding cassette domain-containing protein [Escherichia coli]EGI4392236.1 ATP-binding cassette domain-containing protein [Escherichia coli]EHH6240934.1 ATP-binding cassette domain-containing protein [Escherichia coli]
MLQISHLYADYGGKPALEDINLTLESGELLVVLGPSGCGKTTLLNLIAGFVPYQHGSIQLAGKRIEGPGAERGVVFQNEGLLPWRNVQDNVAFGLQLAGIEKMQRLEIAHQMLKKVGLEGAEKRYIWQLSGGQRQRVGIARALAGVKSVQQVRIRAAQSLGASRAQVLWFVILPGALPEILTGLRIGLGVGWSTLVAAELIAATRGLGFMVQSAGEFLATDVVLAGIAVIAIIAFLLELGLRALQRRLTPWHGEVQ